MLVRKAIQNCAMEWSYSSGKVYADPFDEVELDVIFNDPDGQERCVPAFWAGGQNWRVRYASPKVGTHHFHTVCSDQTNPSLDGIEGALEVAPYQGDNYLLKHGPLRVSQDRRYLEHLDGTPFFWLADTWWMGLCQRLDWPGSFQLLTADRVNKGYTVIQMVAGLYPDMPPFDPRGANEAGQAWEKDFARINPAYFDMADLRFNWLVSSGLVPCIVGCWGYFLDFAGPQVIKKHWRNLIARYGAYPVVWCLSGETLMPYYLSDAWRIENDQEYRAKARPAWTDIARYVKAIDPYHHPLSTHPCWPEGSREMIDESLVDFEMLQTGHYDRKSIPNTVEQVVAAYARQPRMPVINSEVCYEGIYEGSREEIQRYMFWACLLSGTCGHTYGAQGLWNMSSRKEPYGASPLHDVAHGDQVWEEAYQLPGCIHVGLGKKLLERYQWWRFESHPEWVEPRWSKDNYVLPFAGGIPGEVRLVYIPPLTEAKEMKNLESGVAYRAFFFSPKNGNEHQIGKAQADEKGMWKIPFPPIHQDWVLVLERLRD